MYGQVNAQNNWWGSNNNPSNQVYGIKVDYSNWLYMTETFDPSNKVKGIGNVTVSFNNIYNGTIINPINPSAGCIPDGALVSFYSPMGTFNPISSTTTNGITTGIFTATILGNDWIIATTDNQLISNLCIVNNLVPVAGFTANTTSGLNPLIVQFTDQSNGNVTNYYWDFGDGTTSTDKNPIHNYNTPGTYTITEIVTGPGGTNKITLTNYITVFNSTAPNVTATPDTGIYNSTKSVTLTSDQSGSKIYYTTDGSDPQTSPTKIPYSNPIPISNTTTLQYAAVNEGGVWSTKYGKTYTIDTSIPTVTVNPIGGLYNTTKTVTLTGSDADTNTTIYYTTDGTDPQTSQTQTTYIGPITIETTTTLRYIDIDQANNWSLEYTQTYTIIHAPVANFTVNTTSGTGPLKVQFNDNSTGNITDWNWNFGDGTSTDKTPTHIYNTPGTYTVTLIVTGAGGSNTQTFTDYITVNWPAPIVNFTVNSTTGIAPETVHFTDKSTGNISSYAWDFNNDRIIDSTNQNPTWTYNSAGTYTVIETVTGPGGSNSLILTNYINITPDTIAPTANATLASGLYNSNQIVNLTAIDNKDPNPKIYYTINGTSPTKNSTLYNGQISVKQTTTLKYITIDNAGNISPVFTQTYTIDTTAPTVKVNFKGGLYNTNKVVTLTMSEPGNIYYTLNGTTPTIKSTIYTKPITISSTSNLKYIAIDFSKNKSSIYEQNYIIDKTAPKIINTNPKYNAINVPLTTPITIYFNENILKGINYNDVYVINVKTGKKVQITKTLSKNTLTIKMTKSRLHNNKYIIYIPKNAFKDQIGNLTAKYTIPFKTG